MEILETGELQRIEYENTEDVETINLFQGIYGVGQYHLQKSFIFRRCMLIPSWRRPTYLQAVTRHSSGTQGAVDRSKTSLLAPTE